MSDVIRKAVELSDNDAISPISWPGFVRIVGESIALDALAAQLRRQCRAKDVWTDVLIMRIGSGRDEPGPDYDEAMADIQDIVESGVLDND